MFDVVALGETLIDFTPSGVNELGLQIFSCNPGGAPANVLAMHARLGGKTAFIGMVGNDAFGQFLRKTMKDAGIDVSGLQTTADVNTTLAFVQLDDKGDRSFSFYRNPGADICLRAEDVPQTLLKDCRIFHFGSVSLTDEPSRSATLYAAKAAKESGAVISYDPNYRTPLWKSEEEAVAIMQKGLELADVVKVSEEEMFLLTGERGLEAGAAALARAGASLVLVTRGAKGAFFYTAHCHGSCPAYRVPVIDTTGSGDAFLGTLLHQLSGIEKKDIGLLSREKLDGIVRNCNAAGSLTAMAKGAIPAMPDQQQILQCVKERPVEE